LIHRPVESVLVKTAGSRVMNGGCAPFLQFARSGYVISAKTANEYFGLID
jgi:hypothetical protein